MSRRQGRIGGTEFASVEITYIRGPSPRHSRRPVLIEVGSNSNLTGEVSGFAPPGDIHRVRNVSDSTAISLHIYGTDLWPHRLQRPALLRPPGPLNQ